MCMIPPFRYSPITSVTSLINPIPLIIMYIYLQCTYATVVGKKRPPTVPKVGDVVNARVLKTSIRHVNLDIVPVDTLETFSGLLRSSDVRSSDIDSVEVHKCFRPGDIVRAKVLSLGDQRSYYLTTAEEDLGVVQCRSKKTGNLLVPLDSKTVICRESGETEQRKAAVVAE
jgi:exosome complex component CSL4